jgi:hypothetical protein
MTQTSRQPDGIGQVRPPPDTLELTLGATQEFVALTTYRKAADLIDDPNAALVLRRIAAQEGRHMHFYRRAALVFLDEPWNSYVASQLPGHLWRPPGVDLLGTTAWLHVFSPLLAYEDYRSRLLRMDQLLQQMPGFQRRHLMEDFLRRHGFPIPALDHGERPATALTMRSV